MILRLEDRIGVGAYADVFRTDNPEVACKLLKASPRSNWQNTAVKIVRSEALAYQIAQNDDVLRSYVPRCFGTASVSSVIATGDIDVSDRYVRDAALMLELIQIVEEEKLCGADIALFPHLRALIDRFFAQGIDAGDASVVNFTVPSTTRVFDFLPWGFSEALTQYLASAADGA